MQKLIESQNRLLTFKLIHLFTLLVIDISVVFINPDDLSISPDQIAIQFH